MAASCSIAPHSGLVPCWIARTQLVQAGGRQLEEWSELRSCLELWDRIEFLERARERIGEAPCRPRSEFLDLRIEVQIEDSASQVLRNIQLALHKGPVNDQLHSFVGKARPFPRLYFPPHRLKVPLHAVYSNRENVHEA